MKKTSTTNILAKIFKKKPVKKVKTKVVAEEVLSDEKVVSEEPQTALGKLWKWFNT